MKRLLPILLLAAATLGVHAQNKGIKADDFGRIALTAYLPNDTDMPAAAKQVLVNKLGQIALKNGLASTGYNSRFIFTATVDVLGSELTASVPQMHVMTLNFNFYVGDGVDGTLFSSTSITQKGVGDTEAKAYLAALKGISTSNAAFKPMLDKGKNRIIEYYNSQCDFILATAKAEAARDQYEDAILHLLLVPDVCKECYEQCMAETETIYAQMLDRDCVSKLSEARNIWSARQDSIAAEEACGILATIDPKSPSYGQAEKLREEIHKFIADKNDYQRMSALLARLETIEEQQRQHETELTLIEAAREVGVEQAKAQAQAQPTTVIVAPTTIQAAPAPTPTAAKPAATTSSAPAQPAADPNVNPTLYNVNWW